MAKRAVIRKVVKWGGLVASALLVAAWVGSCWYSVGWAPGDGEISVIGGRWCLAVPLSPLGLGGGGRRFESWPTFWQMEWRFDWGQSPVSQYVYVPLWFPLLIVVGATAWAWWADARERRRQRVGACPACGYDRRGLEVGKVCPECGAAAGV